MVKVSSVPSVPSTRQVSTLSLPYYSLLYFYNYMQCELVITGIENVY
jgi:hypothetical protein